MKYQDPSINQTGHTNGIPKTPHTYGTRMEFPRRYINHIYPTTLKKVTYPYSNIDRIPDTRMKVPTDIHIHNLSGHMNGTNIQAHRTPIK